MRRETASPNPAASTLGSQAGAGMLGVIALLGVSFVLVQGTLFYKSRTSAALSGSASRNRQLSPSSRTRRPAP